MNRTDLRIKLLQNGYTPLANDHKRCLLEGWSRLDVTEDLIRSKAWARNGRSRDTGIRCGDVVGIDIDVLDSALQQQCRDLAVEMFGATPLVRIGDPRKSLLLYRYQGERVGKIRSGRYGEQLVELLLYGTQFGAFGRHSDSHEYEWPDQSPLDVPIDDLPVAGLEDLRAYIDACRAIFEAAGLEKVSDGGESGIGYKVVHDLEWDMEFDVVDHGFLSVADIVGMLENMPGASLRCSMEPLREDADNPSSGHITLNDDGQVVISDHPAAVTHKLVVVSYTHLTLPTKCRKCRSRWSPYH